MPTSDELIHQLNGAKVFSKLGLQHGYHQILLAPESGYLTTFRTHKGLHHHVRVQYGTSAASEVFQHAISQALAGIEGVINISDDILIFGTTQAARRKIFWDHFGWELCNRAYYNPDPNPDRLTVILFLP